MRILSALLLLCGLAVSAHAQLVVPDRPYRCAPDETSCQTTTNLPPLEQLGDSGRSYTIRYLEFSDKGQLYEKKEMKETLDAIHAASSSAKKTLLVVYVNGWHNNADAPHCSDPTTTSCADVGRFRDTLLKRLAVQFSEDYNVMGLYIGWRGMTLHFAPFEYALTYWNRRNVAQRIGETGVRHAVQEIKNAVGENRDRFIFVLAGHSFGARVLESAADGVKDAEGEKFKGFMTEYRHCGETSHEACRPAETAQSATAEVPADLVVYLNAATSSALTRRTIDETEALCKRHPERTICGANPFYLAVTTHADWATGWLMPIANLLTPWRLASWLHPISAANSPWMRTHHQPEMGAPDYACPETGEAPVHGFCFHILQEKANQPGAEESSQPQLARGRPHVVVRPIGGKTQHVFWVFKVEKNVMKGHTDVWNETVTNMLSEVIYLHLNRRT